MENLIKRIDHLNKYIGESVSWISVILVVLICIDVLMRYFFNTTKTWIIELEWHLFGLLFMLGAAYAFQKDQHVRVDLFYTKFSARKKSIINFAGNILFLIPWCIVVIYTSFEYASNSFYFREGSPNPGGLPARYIIKFAITLAFILLAFQAISQSLKIVKSKFNHDPEKEV